MCAPLRALVLLAALVPLARAEAGAGAAGTDRRNVLFIVVDDMRPQLEPYGFDRLRAYTPNMAAFSQTAVTFDNAHTQISICAPSRNSFMSGRRPDTTLAWNFLNDFRRGPGENWTAMPQYFKESGYYTSGAGKVYHPNLPPDDDYPKSWSKPWRRAGPIGVCPNNMTWCARPWSEFQATGDVVVANLVVAELKNQTGRDSPFFIAAGLHKPHLPFRFPVDFLQYFNDTDAVPLPANPGYPKGGARVAWHNCLGNNGGNWGRFSDMRYPLTRSQNLPAATMRELRRGYQAAISYTDWNIGRILKQLDESGLSNSTVVVITADHGWNLGEHSEWCKMTNWETGTRVPLMIRDPQSPQSHGRRTASPAELVDLYRTLTDLAGLPEPEAGVQGKSLGPLVRDPSSEPPDSHVALSQFPRCYTSPMVIPNWADRHLHEFAEDCQWTNRTLFDIMGYSLRTPQYRFTQWVLWNRSRLAPEWGRVNASELYTHTEPTPGPDPLNNENINHAADPAYAPLVARLAAQLRQAFEPSTPTGVI